MADAIAAAAPTLRPPLPALSNANTILQVSERAKRHQYPQIHSKKWPLHFNTRRGFWAHGIPKVVASAGEHGPSLILKNKGVETSYELKGTSIFLVGMHGTMKTNSGKLLAEILRYYYFDSDSLVEQAAGGEASAKLFQEKDERGFRDSETEVLKQLSSMGRLVISAGDGAVQSSTNLAYLRYGISIWIDVPLDMLAKEAMDSHSRCPSRWGISTSDSYSEIIAKLTSFYEEMKGGYATADATVSIQKVASQLGYDDVDAMTPEDVAVEVLKEIEKLTRVKKMMEAAAKPF